MDEENSPEGKSKSFGRKRLRKRRGKNTSVEYMDEDEKSNMQSIFLNKKAKKLGDDKDESPDLNIVSKKKRRLRNRRGKNY